MKLLLAVAIEKRDEKPTRATSDSSFEKRLAGRLVRNGGDAASTLAEQRERSRTRLLASERQ
jgi:hypothetical protein